MQQHRLLADRHVFDRTVVEVLRLPNGTVGVIRSGKAGAISVDHAFKQRVRCETIGTLHTGSGAFAGRIEAGDAGPSEQVGANAAHPVVGRGSHGNGFLAPIEAERTRVGVDGREPVA